MIDKLLTIKDVAAILSINQKYLHNKWPDILLPGGIVNPIRITKKSIRFKSSEINRMIESRRVL